jgi:hypothetical protein
MICISIFLFNLWGQILNKRSINMAHDVNVGKGLVGVDKILARYLWNQKTAPSPSELFDDKWI